MPHALYDVHPDDVKKLISYNPDTGAFKWKRRSREWFKDERSMRIWNSRWAGKPAFTYIEEGKYVRGNILGTNITAHKIAWVCHFGEWPSEVIDHINGDPSDNRINNLRECSFSENRKNTKSHKGSTSEFVGVSWSKNAKKWAAQICSDGRKEHIGYFGSEHEAAIARDKRARELFGEYANLNFVDK